MKIEIKDVLTLSDGNKYVVCSKTNYQGDDYLYLIDMENYTNIKFGREKNRDGKITIIEIEDEQLIRTLIPLLFEEAKGILQEIQEEQS